MRFQDAISGYTAAQIIAALGCPRGTAYDWLDGRREPPAWQQPHWLAILKSANKTPQPTSSRAARKKKS